MTFAQWQEGSMAEDHRLRFFIYSMVVDREVSNSSFKPTERKLPYFILK